MDTTMVDTLNFEETSIVSDAADTVERRLSLRLLAYWRQADPRGPLPAPDKIEPTDFRDLWANCFLIDVPASDARPVFRSTGATFESWAGGNLAGKTIDTLSPELFPGSALAFVDEVLRKSVPITRGGEARDANGGILLYRSIILPLSDNGTTVTGLLGGVNCREIVED